MENMKYGMRGYTKNGQRGYCYFSNDFYAVLERYVLDTNRKYRPTLWVHDGEDYVRVHDFRFSVLSPDTYKKYLAERIIESDKLLGMV